MDRLRLDLHRFEIESFATQPETTDLATQQAVVAVSVGCRETWFTCDPYTIATINTI